MNAPGVINLPTRASLHSLSRESTPFYASNVDLRYNHDALIIPDLFFRAEYKGIDINLLMLPTGTQPYVTSQTSYVFVSVYL